MAAPLVPWVNDGDAGNAAVTKRPLKYILTASGMDVDNVGFTGFMPVHNVKAYQAVGNNATDDAAHVQDACTGAAVSGGIVYVPRSTYKMLSGVTLGSNVRIVGEGYAKSIFNFSIAGGVGFTATSKTNVDIEGIAVTGLLAMGVLFQSSTNVAVQYCSLSGCTSSTHATTYAAGVMAWLSDDVTVHRSWFSGNGYVGGPGLSSDIQVGGNGANTGTERTFITHNKCFSTAVQTNIIAYDVQHSQFLHNVCTGAKSFLNVGLGLYDHGGYGIALYRTGVNSGNMRGNRVAFNTVYSVEGIGIYLQSCDDSSAVDNDVRDAGSIMDDTTLIVAGIAITNCTRCVVSRNNIKDCFKGGIGVGGTPSDHHIITDNIIDGVTGRGIFLRGPLKGNLIARNRIKSVTVDGIGTFPTPQTITNTKIIDNIIELATVHGISVYGFSNGDLSDNTVTLCGNDGIQLVTGSYNKVDDNTVIDGGTTTTNTFTAISISGSTRTKARRNTCANTGGTGFKFGLAADVTSTNLTLENNDITGMLTSPLAVTLTSTTVIRNNPGYNPVGPSAITVTASPMTYTAGPSPETVSVLGGTVSSVTKGGATLASVTNCQISLEPNQAIVVTYTVAPTMAKDVA